MDMVNVVMLYLVIISDDTNEFLPGNNKDSLNWTENWVKVAKDVGNYGSNSDDDFFGNSWNFGGVSKFWRWV